jgi:hypothetical protein
MPSGRATFSAISAGKAEHLSALGGTAISQNDRRQTVEAKVAALFLRYPSHDLGGRIGQGARKCLGHEPLDNDTEPAVLRRPMTFAEVYLGLVTQSDFRKNPRGELGTRTATLDRAGIAKLRNCWVYHLDRVNPL